MQKPSRKNSHKERIFSLPQNKIDFSYQKEHQDKNHGEEIKSKNNAEEPALLTVNKIRDSLKYLDGWQLTNDHKMAYREFIAHDFMAAVDLILQIARIAEDEKHHPDIHLTQYRNLRVGLTSHDAGGLTQKDLTVARKINDLPILNKAVSVDLQLQNKEQDSKVSLKTKNKPKQGLGLALKKNANKTKEIKIKRSSNRLDQLIKKA